MAVSIDTDGGAGERVLAFSPSTPCTPAAPREPFSPFCPGRPGSLVWHTLQAFYQRRAQTERGVKAETPKDADRLESILVMLAHTGQYSTAQNKGDNKSDCTHTKDITLKLDTCVVTSGENTRSPLRLGSLLHCVGDL